MRRELRRLRTLALRRGVCPEHPSLGVWCAHCDMEWTGTDAELQQCGDLACKSIGDAPPLPKTRCRCGQEALCLECAARWLKRHPERATETLTPEERARYNTLITLLQPRPRR
jgi:hypothetical protein